MSIAVIDASAAIDILTGRPPASEAKAALVAASQLVTPAHFDAEVFSGLARMRRAGELADIGPHLAELGRLGVERIPVVPLLTTAAGLLDRVAAKDALYVAMALTIGGWLLTTDDRLRRAVKNIVPTRPGGS